MLNLPVYNTQGQEIENLKLDAALFDGRVNSDAMHQAVGAYLARQRKGLASTKTMGEVSGGGRKPWRQKGTGRARVGSIRSPLWRHGGVIFGPHPRDFSYSLPQRLRDTALKSSLNAKANQGKLVILDALDLSLPKTKEALKLFSHFEKKPAAKSKKQPKTKPEKILVLSEKIDRNLRLAVRNIPFVSINRAQDTHVYEVLNAEKLFVTRGALKALAQRLK